MSDLIAIAEAVVAEINAQAEASAWDVDTQPAEFSYDPEPNLDQVQANGPLVFVTPEATSTEPNVRGANQRLCTVAISVVAKVASSEQDEVAPWLTFLDALADHFLGEGESFRVASPPAACIAARTLLNLGGLREKRAFAGTVELDFLVMT